MHLFRLPSASPHGNLSLNQQHEDAFCVDQALLLR